mgnify:CR=1 FL=1
MDKRIEISFCKHKIETKQSDKVIEKNISSIKMTIFKTNQLEKYKK